MRVAQGLTKSSKKRSSSYQLFDHSRPRFAALINNTTNQCLGSQPKHSLSISCNSEAVLATSRKAKELCFSSVNEDSCLYADVECGAALKSPPRIACNAGIFPPFGDLRKLYNGEQLDEVLRAVENLDQRDIPIPKDILYCLLHGCSKTKDLAASRRLHSIMSKRGLDRISIFGDHLIRLFASCGSLVEANKIFCIVSKPSVYTWNAIISTHISLEQSEKALELYHKMQQSGTKPSKVTFLYILKACSTMEALGQGRSIHEQIFRRGFETDRVIGNTLVDMYAKCGDLEKALKVFNELLNRDVVSYGAIITGYAQHGHGVAALQLFARMQQEGIKPNKVIFLCIMKACGKTQAVEQGRLIHEQVIKGELLSDLLVGSTLVDMYVKCGNLNEAYDTFDKLLRRNVVTWGAMIAGYVQHGDGHTVLEFFETMQQEGINPDRAIFLGTLKACGSIGAIGHGRLIHIQIVRSGLESDMAVGNTIIDMYAKCGSLQEASRVFDSLLNRDVVSWGAMITGYLLSGKYKVAWHCLKDMQLEGFKPSEVIFTSVLAGCSQAGLVEEGHQLFKAMKEDYGKTPGLEHYNGMVDLLCRAGQLDEAKKLLDRMPIQPGIVAWRSLLTGCRTYGNMELGKHCFDKLVRLNPAGASGYVLMSNIYADAHLWDNVGNLLDLRKCAAAPKKPGRACIELSNNRMQEFIVSSKNDEQNDESYVKVRNIGRLIKEKGYVPELNIVLEHMLNENKEDVLCGQSENMAIAFGSLCTSEGGTIRTTKILRICIGWHHATVDSFKIESQDIALRDGYHAHFCEDCFS